MVNCLKRTLTPSKQGVPLSYLLSQPLSLATQFVAIIQASADSCTRADHATTRRLGFGVGVRVIIRVRVRANELAPAGPAHPSIRTNRDWRFGASF